MTKRRIVASAVTASAVVAGLALAATDPVAAAPPEPQTGTFELPTDFTFCEFPIVATLDGKGKTIEKERFTIATSPGLKITLEANGNSYVFNATGSFKITPQADGNVLYEYRGNNLVSDPTVGFLALSGHFTWLSDADGNSVRPLSTGTGRTTDLCALLGP